MIHVLAFLCVFPNFINKKLLHWVSSLSKGWHVEGEAAGHKVLCNAPPQGAKSGSDNHSEIEMLTLNTKNGSNTIIISNFKFKI
jgi:hypothetical protein